MPNAARPPPHRPIVMPHDFNIVSNGKREARRMWNACKPTGTHARTHDSHTHRMCANYGAIGIAFTAFGTYSVSVAYHCDFIERLCKTQVWNRILSDEMHRNRITFCVRLIPSLSTHSVGPISSTAKRRKRNFDINFSLFVDSCQPQHTHTVEPWTWFHNRSLSFWFSSLSSICDTRAQCLFSILCRPERPTNRRTPKIEHNHKHFRSTSCIICIHAAVPAIEIKWHTFIHPSHSIPFIRLVNSIFAASRLVFLFLSFVIYDLWILNFVTRSTALNSSHVNRSGWMAARISTHHLSISLFCSLPIEMRIYDITAQSTHITRRHTSSTFQFTAFYSVKSSIRIYDSRINSVHIG